MNAPGLSFRAMSARASIPAPALVDPTWLHAQEEDFEGATLERTWRLFVFFLPT